MVALFALLTFPISEAKAVSIIDLPFPFWPELVLAEHANFLW